MKSERLETTIYKLELSTTEASWLRGLLQNPLLEDGVDPSNEDPTDRKMRELFWSALK